MFPFKNIMYVYISIFKKRETALLSQPLYFCVLILSATVYHLAAIKYSKNKWESTSAGSM